ncbi:MAG: methyltransferase [Myxococcota bacterium]
MSARIARRSESLVLDPEVLRAGPVCAFQSSRAVAEHGGIAVQPWRDRFLADEQAGLDVRAAADGIPSGSFGQVVVHLQKSRAATFEDLAAAWRILAPDGELLFCGPNTLGIASAVKRLAEQLGEPGVVVANRARARVVRFRKRADHAPVREGSEPIQVPLQRVEPAGRSAGQAGRGVADTLELETLPGVFSAKRLDPGSELLLEAFARVARATPPRRIVDLGCGTGVLGLVAATLLPEAEVLLVDADARAVACTRRNIERLGLAARCRAAWWDAREQPIDQGFELALVNPPFHHRGPEVDLAPALALFASLAGWLAPRASALLVANRTLPYEAPLARLGELALIADVRGYKLLSLSLDRRARASGERGRSAPGGRSSGSSRRPTRSR